MAAVVEAVRANDPERFKSLFGPEAQFFVGLTEPERSAAQRLRFLALAEEAVNLVAKDENTRVVQIGKVAWPLAIPITRSGQTWQFDLVAGKDEILNRVVGENELAAIEACGAYVRAQLEYMLADRDGDGVFEYAQRFGSSPGKRDGLYWEGERQSDRGPLPSWFANAAFDPAVPGVAAVKRDPSYGYLFRILTRQGAAAPGGAHGYVINGNMIAGHAMVAFPERWGESGVMTFIVGVNGRVYQKNLGPNTAALARQLAEFNPDATWKPVAE
ncbi:MAG: DUF2950 family protein [Rhodospirillales bacterium]|nr:MAG: DUF2950 family protein [Rhodospirillales bacterium]